MKLCHFKQKSAIWDSAKWTLQYGIRQSGTNSFKTHILIFSTVISTLYRGKNTRIIKVNPFHDDTTAIKNISLPVPSCFPRRGHRGKD